MKGVNVGMLVLAAIAVLACSDLYQKNHGDGQIGIFQLAYYLTVFGLISSPLLFGAAIWRLVRRGARLQEIVQWSWMPVLATAVFGCNWLLLRNIP